MSNFINFYGFRNFCLSNFPFLEKDFDALTDYELICKIFEHFENEIKEIDEKYSDILNLRQEFETFKAEIQTEFSSFEDEINLEVDNKLNANYNRVVQLLSDYQILFNNELENLRTDLENQIEQIELGNVIAYNPTNGEYENVSKVITDVYETLRANAISCSEFDALLLTATEFDSKQLSAYDFDVNAKIMLVA